MEREEKQSLEHGKKAIIAAVETFGLVGIGLIYPPVALGCGITAVATTLEVFRQLRLTVKAIEKEMLEEIRQSLKEVADYMDKRMEEHLNTFHADDYEQRPPDPNTATPEQIAAYKEEVLQQATKKPGRGAEN
jgi:hypothetical protein